MSRPKPYLYYAALALMVLSAAGMLVLGIPANGAASDRQDQDHQDTAEPSPDQSIVHLYFADKENNFLSAEERTLVYTSDPVEFGRAIITALIEGPREGLMRTVPAEAQLRSIFVTPDGTAYVDMTAAVKDDHPGGVQTELMTIYSIVNSLILNISEINAVKILIAGHDAMTLAGHIDLRLPIKANMLLIR